MCNQHSHARPKSAFVHRNSTLCAHLRVLRTCCIVCNQLENDSDAWRLRNRPKAFFRRFRRRLACSAPSHHILIMLRFFIFAPRLIALMMMRCRFLSAPSSIHSTQARAILPASSTLEIRFFGEKFDVSTGVASGLCCSRTGLAFGTGVRGLSVERCCLCRLPLRPLSSVPSDSLKAATNVAQPDDCNSPSNGIKETCMASAMLETNCMWLERTSAPCKTHIDLLLPPASLEPRQRE